MNEEATNYDSSATFDNGGCSFFPDSFSIDASSYDDWIYFSFESPCFLAILSVATCFDVLRIFFLATSLFG